MATIKASDVKVLREQTGAGMMDCKKALKETDGDFDAAVKYLREKGMSKAAKKADRVAAEGLTNVKVDDNKAVIYELNSETDFVAKNDQFKQLIEDLGTAILASDAKNLEEAKAQAQVDGKDLDTAIAEATSKIGEKLTLRRLQVVEKTDEQSFGAYVHMGGKISALTVLNGASEEAAKDVAMHVAAINPRYLKSDDISDDVIAAERETLRKEALNEGKPEHIVDKMVEGRLNKYLKEICLVNQPFVKDPDQSVENYVKQAGGDVQSFVRLEVGEGVEKKNEDFADEVKSQMG